MVTSKALSIFDNLNQLTPYAVGFDRVFDQLNTCPLSPSYAADEDDS